MIEKTGTPPLQNVTEIKEVILIAEKGNCLTPYQLERVEKAWVAIKRLREYLERGKAYNNSLFRGRSDEIRVHPLSFGEYYSTVGGDKNEAFDEYAFYGGMPLVLSRPNDAAKMNYLKSLFTEVYIKDIVERKKIERQDVLEQILDLLCSSIGSLTNPVKIVLVFASRK